jgi:RHS repeat-associated protein
LGYTYDGNGNRLTLTATVNGQSHTTGYTYDDAGRLDVVTDPAGRVYDHGYDRNGNRESLAHPNGVATAYTHDNLNRLTNLATTHPTSSRHIQSYRFTLGPAGNRTKIVEHQGLPQQRTLDYSYDSLYRLTGESVTENLGLVYAKTFGYDTTGNRLSQTTTLGPAGSPGPNLQPGTISYGYDTRDRLLSEQLDATPATTYGWDPNGNLTTKDAEATYTWNHENRLVRVEKTDGTTIEHLYDADGNRVRTTTTPPGGSSAITDYMVDTSGSLSHVVAEVNSWASPTLQVLYVRGDDLLSLMRPLVAAPTSAAGWQTRNYHADGIGSIRRLTDEGGNVTDGYTAAAFGGLLGHSGADSQPYFFAGEQYDPNSGLQHHRARWLDARLGAFVSADSWLGRPTDPLTLHKYLYAHADPANSVDPSGRSVLTAGLVGIGIGVTLAAIASLAWRPARTSTEQVSISYQNKFTIRLGNGKDGDLSGSEVELVKTWFRFGFYQAFSGLGVQLLEGGNSQHRVEVLDDCCGGDAGVTDGWRSKVSYAAVASRAREYAGTRPRDEVVRGMGYGLAAIVAHEVFHQYTGAELHNLNDETTYDHHMPLRSPSKFYGQPHWSEGALHFLRKRLAFYP